MRSSISGCNSCDSTNSCTQWLWHSVVVAAVVAAVIVVVIVVIVVATVLAMAEGMAVVAEDKGAA